MDFSRPQPPPDPLQRPSTVGYMPPSLNEGQQQVYPPVEPSNRTQWPTQVHQYTPQAPQQQHHLQHHLQHHQQPGSQPGQNWAQAPYNPAQYGMMPGGQAVVASYFNTPHAQSQPLHQPPLPPVPAYQSDAQPPPSYQSQAPPSFEAPQPHHQTSSAAQQQPSPQGAQNPQHNALSHLQRQSLYGSPQPPAAYQLSGQTAVDPSAQITSPVENRPPYSTAHMNSQYQIPFGQDQSAPGSQPWTSAYASVSQGSNPLAPSALPDTNPAVPNQSVPPMYHPQPSQSAYGPYNHPSVQPPPQGQFNAQSPSSTRPEQHSAHLAHSGQGSFSQYPPDQVQPTVSALQQSSSPVHRQTVPPHQYQQWSAQNASYPPQQAQQFSQHPQAAQDPLQQQHINTQLGSSGPKPPLPPRYQGPALQQDEPVSPILQGRQSVSHDSSGPSRTASSVSRKQNTATPDRNPQHPVSSPPKTDQFTPMAVSASSASTTTASSFPSRKVEDPNGIGATGASALGVGGPSDWEHFGPVYDEVDDMEHYATRKEHGLKDDDDNVEESVVPVELPAALPVEKTSQSIPTHAFEMAGSAPIVVEQENNHVAEGPAMTEGVSLVLAPQQRSSNIISPTPVAAPQVGPPLTASQDAFIDDGSSRMIPGLAQIAQHASGNPEMAPKTAEVTSSVQSLGSVVVDSGPVVPGPSPLALGKQDHSHQRDASQPARTFIMGDMTWTPEQSVNTVSAHALDIQQTDSATPAQMSQFQTLLEEKSQTLLRKEEELGAVRSKLEQVESELSQQKENAMNNRMLSESQAVELVSLREEISLTTKEVDAANREIKNLQVKLANADSQVVNANQIAESEKNVLVAKIATVEAAMAAAKAKAEASCSMIKSELQAALNSQAELTSTVSMAENAKKELESKLTAAEIALTDVQSQIESDKSAKSALQSQLEESKQAFEASKVEMESLKQQLEAAANSPDIAPGLEPWFKGSLERYRAVMYTEASAPTVQEKMKAFQDFVNSESRLRGMDMPFGPDGELKGFSQMQSHPKAAEPTPTQTSSKPQLKLESPNSNDFVIIESAEPERYSPGGRPILVSRPKANRGSSAPVVETIKRESSPTASVDTPLNASAEPASGANAEGTRRTRQTFQPYKPYRHETSPTIGMSKAAHENDADLRRASLAAIVQPSKPAYKPFSYQPDHTGSPVSSGPPSDSDVSRRTNPVSRRAVSVVSASPVTPSPPTSKSLAPLDETFLPDSKESSTDKTSLESAVEDMVPGPLKPSTPMSQQSSPRVAGRTVSTASLSVADTKMSPTDQLLGLLPPVRMPVPASQHPVLEPLLTEVADLSVADYSFIPKMTSVWEAKSRVTRQRLDEERAKRQAELEASSSRLFQDGEIGYAQISSLEDEDRRREAKMLESEGDEEWQSYLTEVFEPVFGRLHEELGRLFQVRVKLEDLLPQAVAGTQAQLAASSGDVPLTDLLSLVVRVQSMQEDRETEVGRAVAERDRRYRKNLARTLYRKGDIREMKRVESALEKQERKNEVQRCTERLERTKPFWKAVKGAVRKGVEDNDSCAQALLEVVEKLGDQPRRGADHTSAGMRTLEVLRELAASSVKLMTTFELVDSCLNDAEYHVVVAQETADGSGSDTFSRLEVEKKDQDAILRADAKKRVDDIENALAQWEALVEKALLGK